VDDPLEIRPSHMYYPPELVVICQTVSNVIMEISLKNLIPRVPPFKVIGIDTDRSAIYDFLLTFHSNHEPISYRL